MEYLVGAIGGVALFAFAILLTRNESAHRVSTLTMSESTIVSLMHKISSMYEEDEDEEDNTEEDEKTRVVFANKKAYWLEKGKFFVAETNGESVLSYTKKEVETMDMSHVELNQLMRIVEALRRSDEDRG
jgi:thymidylate synthase